MSTIIPDSASVWRMSRVAGGGTAEPISRDRILRRERGQGNIHFPCPADHEQDWQLYPVDPYSCSMCTIHIHPHQKQQYTLNEDTQLSYIIQWGLRFKRALFKRIAGLREVKMAWHI